MMRESQAPRQESEEGFPYCAGHLGPDPGLRCARNDSEGGMMMKITEYE